MTAAPVPVGQDTGELGWLLDIYRQTNPRAVLEIGVDQGGTLYHWLANSRPKTRFVAVDDRHVNADRYGEWAGGRFVLPLQGRSQEPQIIDACWSFAPYDFVFVDADHRYDKVKADWDAYRPMVAEGGVMAFHDIAGARRSDPEIQVRRLWKEIKQAGYRTDEKVVTANWWGIGVVYL